MPALRFHRHRSFRSGAIFVALMLQLTALAQSGANSADDFQHIAQQAAAAREAGMSEDAIRFYQRAVKIRPDWDEGWWYLGSLYYDTDHYDQAIPAFKKLVELNPKLGLAWDLLGLSEFETKDYTNSLVHLERGQELGLEDNPEAVKVAKYHIALLFNLNGQFAKATEILTSGFEREHLPDQIKVALGMALLRIPLLPNQVDPSKDALIHAASETAALLAQNNLEQAMQSFQKVLKDYPDTPYLHYQYASALASASRYDEAEAQLRAEMRITPGSALPYLGIASIGLQRNHRQDALQSAERAVGLAPQSRAAHEMKRQALIALGKSEEAAKEAKTLSDLPSEAAEIDVNVARAYARGTAAPRTRPEQTPEQDPGAVGNTEDKSATFAQLAAQATAAQQSGRPDDSIRFYQSALEIRPDWEEGWANLGMLYFSSSRYADAIPVLKTTVGLNPRRSDAWALLGLSEFESKDYQNSLLHLTRAQELGLAGNAAAVRIAKYHIAALLNLNGEFEKAMDLLIPEVGPGPAADKIKLALGLALLRIPLLPDQIAPGKSGLIQSAGEAAALLSESRYDQAFPILQQMLKENPDTPYLHYAYGSALASLSRYDEAVAQLREETRINPGTALPYIRMASIALLLHRPQDALPSGERAVVLAPQSAEAHYVLGRIMLEMGEAGQAVKELESASKLAPNSPEVHFNLARAYTKAKLPEQAEKERAIFTRLNTQAERQKSARGDHSHVVGSRDRGGLTPPETGVAGPLPE
jgi:tetratricopeptide (TPR) repeat protein